MRPGERDKYIANNTMKCPHCGKDKIIRLFWLRDTNEILDVCRACDRKIKEQEAVQIALSVLSKIKL